MWHLHTLNTDYLGMIEQYNGWVEWPLDFAESSGWPVLYRMLPLHLEEAVNPSRKKLFRGMLQLTD